MGSMPKTKKKNIPKSVNEMSKEVLQETLKKKKECNAKALQTVENLCEESVEEEWFLENLQFINQCHFDDAIVERAISKMCGYPLCKNKLDKIPAQQYHISTRYNKVFDITERKNFCSSSCYKSALHVKKQLFTSPLWFRDQEVIPKYTVLKSKSSLGEEVVFFPDKIQPEADDAREKNNAEEVNLGKNVKELEERCSNLTIKDSEDSVCDETESRAGETANVCDNVKAENSTATTNISDNSQNSTATANIIDNSQNSTATANISDNSQNSTATANISDNSQNSTATANISDNSQNSTSTANISDNSRNSPVEENKKEIKASPETLQNVQSKKVEKAKKIKEEPVNVVRKIEKCIFEWFSLDTLFYLYGEQKLKELFQDKASAIKEVLNSKLSMAGFSEKIDRMVKLYGLFDTDSFSSKETKTNLKPLPDYSALKEEGKTLEIKVKAFYQGLLEVKAPEKEEKEEKKKEEEESASESEPIYLPLIDAHAQMALRRKIVLDKLNRVIPDIMKVFNSDYVLQMNDVRNLVSTFALDAHNIIFKPVEWILVGTVLLRLLSLKNKNLESVMKCESSKNQIALILMNYELEKDYLDKLIIRLTDSENLMTKLNDINR